MAKFWNFESIPITILHAKGLNYSNFKASTKERDLHDAYARVWHTLGDLQPGGPYAGTAAPSRQRMQRSSSAYSK